MCPPRRLERYKELLQGASREARGVLMFRRPTDPRTLLLLARSIACAIWRRDVPAASRLLRSHAAAADFIYAEGSKVVL
eukprot:8595643-Pyramimonas_sp.AAC.1